MVADPGQKSLPATAGIPSPGSASRWRITRTTGLIPTMPPAFPPPIPAAAQLWGLDPSVIFLNHGSFGACPKPVLERQGELRERMEREPVLFLHRELGGLLDDARAALARLVHCDPDDLAFVPNATTGVNTVLRGIELRAGDQVVLTSHEYNACRNAVVAHTARAGAQAVVAEVPWPLPGPDAVVEAVVRALSPKTRLVLIDHVTSQSGVVFPVERIVRECAAKGIDVLVDGAHAPGMLELDIPSLGAAYYTGNCHKWLCAPKGTALLWVRRDKQESLLPIAVSHGYNDQRQDRSRFRLLFDWAGTDDPTAYLCVPAAIRFLEGLLPGGLPALRERNRSLAIAARALLCDALGVPPPAPDAMLGSLAAVPLPRPPATPPAPPLFLHPLQVELWEKARIEVPVMNWPSAERAQLRMSAQAYNEAGHYARLAELLAGAFPRR
jgi:isopenicillin-N epimerase